MTPGSELRAAVAGLYEVFRAHDVVEHIDTCDCPSCVHPDVARRMIETPGSRSSKELVTEWIHSAHASQPARDIKHFLPRIVELVAANEAPNHHDTVFVLDRLGAHDWSTWPVNERDAITRALDALFDAALDASEPLYEESIASVLFLLVRAGVPVERYLARWESRATSAADAKLRELRDAITNDGFDAESPLFVGHEAKPRVTQAAAKVLDWLQRDAVAQRAKNPLAK